MVVFSGSEKMEGSKFLIVGLVLAICAFIFQLIGLASPYWIVAEITSLKMNFGLWKYCFQSPILSHTTICRDVNAIITEGILLFYLYMTKERINIYSN